MEVQQVSLKKQELLTLPDTFYCQVSSCSYMYVYCQQNISLVHVLDIGMLIDCPLFLALNIFGFQKRNIRLLHNVNKIFVISVSFYVSFITSTVVMAGYIILIYRNYQRDMRKMYNGDFSFLPRKVRKTDNKSFVVSIHLN